jgi:hypothetical protein
VARMGEWRGVHRVMVGKSEGDPDIDGRIILRSSGNGRGLWRLDGVGSG